MLSVVIADRPEDLLDELVGRLGAPGDDPFAREWVSVPSLGVRDWLRRRLSERLGAGAAHDGIAANIDMPFPGALRWTVLDAHRAHADLAGAPDPWQVDRLVWTVLDVLADPPGPLDPRLTRTDGVPLAGRARPVADLFDRYATHRPQMVLGWLGGDDLGPDGSELRPGDRWQPALYRAVHERTRVLHGDIGSPAERFADALDLARSGRLDLRDRRGVELPGRMFVFGQSILTADLGPLLDAVAAHRDVTALLLSPSACTSVELARAAADAPPVLAANGTTWAFPRDPTRQHLLGGHPLLTTWGQRPLESALLLGAGGVTPTARTADSGSDTGAHDSLLRRLQADLRRGSTDGEPFTVGPRDRSVQVHAAPGPTRQVEVLRDTLLALLRDNDDLCEADIAVLCPQLDRFAPVLTAVLGPSAEVGEQPAEGSTPNLRYTVVDRSARSFNPVLDAMATLLDVLPGRADATSVRALLQSPAVRERFGLTTEDLSLLGQWIDDAHIRWGLDSDHRRRWDVASDDANSWSSGVDQLMMGLALGDDLDGGDDTGGDSGDDSRAHRPGAGALALGGVAPMTLADGDLPGAGRLAAALRSLAEVHHLLVEGGSRTITQWSHDLARAADLMVAPARFEDWQRARFDEVVAELSAASVGAAGIPSGIPLEFGDVRRLLAPALTGSRTRADLGHGSIVVARPSLLAGVPFRVVCLLGLDSDSLPAGRVDGDDLLVDAPVVGDRDVRAEARAELLAGIGAARDTLVITCTSRDVRNNKAVPGAVVLDELHELLATTTGHTTSEIRDGAAGIVVQHPRQAFDPVNFTSRDGAPPVGFDPVARSGAAALLAAAGAAPSPPEPFLRSPLADTADPSAPVELADLHRFFAHPVRRFLRARLNVVVPTRSEQTDDELPTSLVPLEQYSVGQTLLTTGLSLPHTSDVVVEPSGAAGHPSVARQIAWFRAEGLLPPPALANAVLAEVSTEVREILDAAEALGVRGAHTASHPIDVTLGDGTRLVGAVTGCREASPPGPVRILFSRPKPKHRVAVALDLLALTVASPSVEWRAVLITRGRSKAKAKVTVAELRVAGHGPGGRGRTASDALTTVVDQFRDGLRAPLPLFDSTSWTQWHEPTRAKGAWFNPNYGGERTDPYNAAVFGGVEYADLEAGSFAGHTLRGEAERLWGTLGSALVEVEGDSP